MTKQKFDHEILLLQGGIAVPVDAVGWPSRLDLSPIDRAWLPWRVARLG
jgi:hypothetical protein